MSQVLIRIKKSFPFPKDDLEIIKRRILHWANQRDILLFLDSNEYVHTQGRYECLCGVDALLAIEQDDAQLTGLKTEFSQQKDWLFGHFSYDFKNKLEKLSSHHTAKHHFPDLYFFRPQTVCYIHRGENVLWIETLDPADPQDVWNEIQDLEIQTSLPNNKPFVFEKRMQQEEYVSTIEKLKKHIVAGDCYEINFCNEAFCNKVNINPLPAFEKLNSISKAPFAAYYKLKRHALMCASPERYLYKNKAVITAQPIKGTAARSADREQDELQKDKLRNDTKERSENVMIVDLMRNDLARFCEPNSVIVEELFGIYTFPQVHQMISSISGKLRDDLSLFDAIRFSFPMGSMTGAPKVMVMKLIELYEKSRRELFSGSVGYISPDGNFDFNVVIRSLFYNDETQYLSYQTGGAITYHSNPLKEWEETLVKAAALEKVFQ